MDWITRQKLAGNYGFSNDKERLIYESKKKWQEQLDEGINTEIVDIDNNKNVQVVIQEHQNPLNEDKEDRKILVPNTISFHRGSVVTWKGEHWLIVNDISATDDNGVYITARILKELTIMNWVDVDDKTTIRSYPCVATAKLLYTLGIDEGKQIITPDGRMNITVVADDYTNKLKSGMRFIFNHLDCFKITYIDHTTMHGLLTIVLEQGETRTTDDLVNNIADGLNIHSYSVTILNGSSATLNYQNQTLQLNVKVMDKDTVIDNPIITYSIDNSYVATVSDTGLVTCKGTGTANITATYQGVSATIQINGVITANDNYTVEITGQNYIKCGQSANYTCQFKNNGTAISKNGLWSILADDGANSTNMATIINQNFTSCTVKANSNNTLGYIRLQCISDNSQIKNTLRIQIRSLI